MPQDKLILVVDDELELADALQEKLTSNSFNVETANDGEEALKVAFDKKPDLILLDLVMPNKDGFEVLTALREDEWGKTVPVILLTNLDDYESLSRVLEKQGHEYLIKTDWKIDEVVAKVKNRLGIE